MGGLAPWHIILLVLVALVLFGGRGKLSGFMGDAAKGIKAFKEGMKEDPAPEAKKAEPAQPLPAAKEEEPIVR